MLGNFKYCNPTKVYFGEEALNYLQDELKKYGNTIMLTYGKNSIKKNGIYDQIVDILKKAGKKVVEDAGVMPNPTLEKLKEGCEIARKNKVDLILAVGGGSVCDYAKAVAVSTYCTEDPWEKYFVKMEPVANPVIPVGTVLTMAGTSSEMNSGTVITNVETKLKIGRIFEEEEMYPKFCIMNPKYTLTLPMYQMVAGCFDVMSHIMEVYFSGEDDNTSDYISEGLLRSIIHSTQIAVKDPQDYEARSNIMWTATWAHNSLNDRGKACDWNAHSIGQAISAYTNATHGMTLSAVSMAYYRYIYKDGLNKFKRFAINVWDVSPEGKTDEQIAEEGLNRMEEYMKNINVVMNISELGVTEDMLEGIADVTLLNTGGYKLLNKDDVIEILRRSM